MPLDLFAWGTGWGDELVYGLSYTLRLALVAYVAGTILGLAAALAALHGPRSLALAIEALAVLLRSVPELLVIFLFYFGGTLALRALLSPFGLERYADVDAFVAGVTAMSLVQAAYTSEVFRGALTAVPRVLVEAAHSLGLKPAQILLRISGPLALRYAFPGLCNLWMVVLKTTPLVSAIGLQDLIRAAGTAGENTKRFFLFYLVVLIVYLGLSALTIWGQSLLERRLFRWAGEGRGA